MVLKVESLFCIRLPHAGLVVGFLTSITCFLNVFDLIGALIAFDDRQPGFHMNSHESTEIIGWEILGYFLVLLSGCFLILGTIKKSPGMILPWLVLSVFGILYGIGRVLFFLVFDISNLYKDLGKLFILILFGVFILPGLAIYTWIGIFSLFQNIRDKKQTRLDKVDAGKLYHLPHSNSQVVISSNRYQI